jgi:hypothetical protein
MTGLRVNFSEKEASSEARSVEVLPRGNYHVKCTDGEVKECGPNSKNPGKEYWHLEFTVQSGPYASRKVWTNVMLFSGALYSLVQIMKAMGFTITEGEMEVPDLEDIIDQEFIVGVTKRKATEEYDESNEVRSFKAFTPDALAKTNVSGGSKKASSLLP